MVWGSGNHTYKHLPQRSFTDNFFMTTFCIAFFEYYLSTVRSLKVGWGGGGKNIGFSNGGKDTDKRIRGVQVT